MKKFICFSLLCGLFMLCSCHVQPNVKSEVQKNDNLVLVGKHIIEGKEYLMVSIKGDTCTDVEEFVFVPVVNKSVDDVSDVTMKVIKKDTINRHDYLVISVGGTILPVHDPDCKECIDIFD